jgi:hypothetical protein
MEENSGMLRDLMLCVEMTFFSIFYLFAFPHQPYLPWLLGRVA